MIRPGTIIQGIYEVAYEVASGGSGTVYACRSALNNRTSESFGTTGETDDIRWAIKEAHTYLPVQFQSEGDGSLSKEDDISKNIQRKMQAQHATEILRMEVDLLKELNHNSLVKVVDVIQGETGLLMVMEYVRGVSLDRVIREKGALSEEEVVRIGLQIADVLGYLHSRGQEVIYRDLKPSNLILRDDGRVVLVDFGAVFTSSDDFPVMKMSFGTRGYAAPEQYLETTVPDPVMDVYAFGRTLTALLTGGSTKTSKLKHVSPALARILKKCTRRNKENRYANIAEVYVDLVYLSEKSFIKQAIQVVKIFSFTACSVPAVIFLTEVWAGNQEAVKPAMLFGGLALAAMFVLQIPDTVFTLTGIKAEQRVKRQRLSARINGTFQIDEQTNSGRALSWDDIALSMDDTSTDLRIDLDNNRVQFVNTKDFIMEQDQVLTRRESYKAVF